MKSFLKTLHDRVIVSWRSTVFGGIALFSSIFTGVLLYQEKVTFDQLQNFVIALPAIAAGITGFIQIFKRDTPKPQ